MEKKTAQNVWTLMCTLYNLGVIAKKNVMVKDSIYYYCSKDTNIGFEKIQPYV